MKTGTSTLQQTLARNQALLDALGQRYFGWPMRTSQKIEEQIHAAGSDRDIIISDEGLWHFCGTSKSDTKRIAEVLTSYETTIIVYFRRPDEFVESWFSQGLKNGLGSPDLISFLGSGFVNSAPYRRPNAGDPVGMQSPGFLANIDLRILDKLSYFEATFPDANVVVRPYERAQLRDGDIVADFFDAIGLDPSTAGVPLERAANENVSPSADTVLFASLLRQRFDVPDDVLQMFLRSHSPPKMRASDKRRILRYDEASAINASMRPVYRDIQSKWGGGASPDFFVDWELDETAFHESSFRDLYDEYVPAGGGLQVAAADPPAVATADGS